MSSVSRTGNCPTNPPSSTSTTPTISTRQRLPCSWNTNKQDHTDELGGPDGGTGGHRHQQAAGRISLLRMYCRIAVTSIQRHFWTPSRSPGLPINAYRHFGGVTRIKHTGKTAKANGGNPKFCVKTIGGKIGKYLFRAVAGTSGYRLVNNITLKGQDVKGSETGQQHLKLEEAVVK